jgi:hypothetical protein
MLFAQRTDPSYSLVLAVSDGASGGVTGLSPTVRVRNGATADSYLDFDDMTFKSSGWVQQDATLIEIGGGHYEYDLAIIDIVDVAGVESIVAEFHVADRLDQSALVVLRQFTEASLTLTVNDLGGVTGLEPTVRVRDTPEDNRWLDWSDMTMKTSGWTLRDAPMTEVGRGHYHRVLDVDAIIGLTGTAVAAEYSVDNGISVAASERLQRVHDIGAAEDTTPPIITNISPPPNGLDLHDVVTLDVLDETGLRFGALLFSADQAGIDDWIHNGSRFGRSYSGTFQQIDTHHIRLSFVRKRGWPTGDRVRFRVVAFDTSGNRVEVDT